jgi:multidrug resistance efflux pump
MDEGSRITIVIDAEGYLGAFRGAVRNLWEGTLGASELSQPVVRNL